MILPPSRYLSSQKETNKTAGSYHAPAGSMIGLAASRPAEDRVVDGDDGRTDLASHATPRNIRAVCMDLTARKTLIQLCARVLIDDYKQH